MSATTPARAFWCRTPSRPNFGDALTPWLIERLSGRYPRFTRPEDRAHKYIVCGSIVSLAGAASTVWGAGLMNADDEISPQARFLAVRGPRTRARALECGADCPPVLGDPALLLPRLLGAGAVPRLGVGLLPHFSDRPHLDDEWAASSGVRLIDVQQDIETVVNEIAACEWVMSSSLHGLIVAHAYGVPAVWVQWRPLPSGDGTKFVDHFESLGHEAPRPVPLQAVASIRWRTIERQAWCPGYIDTDPLWGSCPFQRDDG